MTEPIWVPHRAVLIIHDRQIARHGGAAGMRDGGLLMGSSRGLSTSGSMSAQICFPAPLHMPLLSPRRTHLSTEIRGLPL